MIAEIVLFFFWLACTVGFSRILAMFIDWISSDDGYEPIR